MSASIARSARQVGTIAVQDLPPPARPAAGRRAATGIGVPAPGFRWRRPRAQERGLGAGGELRAEQPVHARRAERDASGFGLDRRGVHPTGRDLAAGPGHDELGDAIGADPGETDLLALLEAQARF